MSRRPLHTASCSGVAPSSPVALTSAPRAISCLTWSRSPDRTAWCRSCPCTRHADANTTAGSLCHVLHLFLYFDREAVPHALLELGDQRAQIAGCAVSGIVDEVRVIIRHLDAAALHALRAHLLQEPRGGNLAFPDHLGRNPCRHL